jgi:ABC-type sugar transport system ATPase subunit
MIQVSNISLRAGNFALDDLNFEVATGAYSVLMGRTGGGKTTILESICGLRRPAGGSIRLLGRDVTLLRPAERGIGYVPQDGALFTTMTVRRQWELPMMLRHRPRAAIERRIAELAEALGITALLDRKPAGLSGGEIQRVALGRALSFAPRIMCLDEPLNALDQATHAEACALLKRLTRSAGITALHVTHDPEEADLLADQILFLDNGRLTSRPATPTTLGAPRKPEAQAGAPSA